MAAECPGLGEFIQPWGGMGSEDGSGGTPKGRDGTWVLLHDAVLVGRVTVLGG